MASLKARAALANLCLIRLQKLGGRATAREIAADLDKPLEQIQPRFSDLFNEGRIRDTGARVRGGRGRPQVIWADAADQEFDAPKNETVTVQADDAPGWFSKYGN